MGNIFEDVDEGLEDILPVTTLHATHAPQDVFHVDDDVLIDREVLVEVACEGYIEVVANLLRAAETAIFLAEVTVIGLGNAVTLVEGTMLLIRMGCVQTQDGTKRGGTGAKVLSESLHHQAHFVVRDVVLRGCASLIFFEDLNAAASFANASKEHITVHMVPGLDELSIGVVFGH